jgi:TRAP-type C4-dicarboxylate transport system substrate-binding protein
MLFKKRFYILLLGIIMILALLSGCGAGESENSQAGAGGTEQTVLRFSSISPIEHMSNTLNEEACDMILERTEGRVRVDYYPANQLGDYTTVYEELMMGTIDIQQGTIPDTVDARLGVAYMPYYATGYDDLVPLYGKDSYLFDLMSEINAKQGVVFMGFDIEGFIGMGCVKEPKDVFTPGTDKGIKMRAPGGLLTMLYPIEDLGYNAVSVPYAEVPTAIQTKVVDGWSGGTPNVNYAWVGEVINTIYINYMHAESTAYIASEKSLAKLSEEDRQIVIDVFNEQSEKSFTMAKENEEVYKKKLADDYGVNVVEYTPEQIKAAADYIRDVTWTRLEPELTKEIVDNLRAELAKLNK